MFRLTQNPIEHSSEVLEIDNPASGGLAFFEGRVRNHNEGFKVKSLDYQCYESMAIKEGEKIIQSAFKKFNIHFAKCVHRHGHLNITDVAVWVGVTAAHRKEAFEACQFIIDQVKAWVPIWKKEYYIDKEAHWVACPNCQIQETKSDYQKGL